MPRSLSLAIAAVLLSGSLVGAAEEASPLSLLRQIDRGFVAIFEKVAPAVVVIHATKKGEDEDAMEIHRFEPFFHEREDADGEKESARERPRLPRESGSEGSGFIIRPDGFILTNVHVVADADRLEVRLKDGRSLPGKVVGLDDNTDIAVIKIEAKELPVAELGDSDALKVGQLVCAIGAPYNQDYSFTCGWVSGKGRSNLLGPKSNPILYEDYIQTDAFINPGNSGGPLFDVEGKVVGMNTLINGLGRGLAFAIPSGMLAEISRQLMEEGKVRRSYIGVRTEALAENVELRRHFREIEKGVVVRTIEANSPALKSDLRASDVITQVDGAAIAVTKDLQKEISHKKVGQVVQLSVWRAGHSILVPIITGESPASFATLSAAQKGPVPAINSETLGLKLRGAEGRAIVTEITAEGPAARAGLLAEDIITDVEAKAVGSPVAVFEGIAAGAGKAGKRGVLLNIERKGRRTFVVLEPGG